LATPGAGPTVESRTAVGWPADWGLTARPTPRAGHHPPIGDPALTAPAPPTTPTDPHPARRLMVHLLPPAGRDGSNTGFTSRADRLTIVGTSDPDTGRIGLMPADSRVFPPADAAPAVLLTWAPEDRRRAGIGHQPRLIDPAHLVPVDADAGIYR